MMRCITIAKEIEKAGEKVTFFAADHESRELFELYAKDLKSCETVVLESDYKDMEGEIPALRKQLLERKVKALLVDSYQVSEEYFSRLSDICTLAYLDDLGKEAYPVDILINYSGYYKALGYEELYKGVSGHKGTQTKLLLGLEYAPLRQQFCTDEESFSSKDDIPEKPEREKSLNILLSSGGADTCNMLTGVLNRAIASGLINNELPTVPRWKVVAGNMVATKEELQKISEEYPCVSVYKNVSDMAALMRDCDIAIAAAGTMLTECAALRLPVIYYQVADNQKYNVDFWQTTGGMLFAGDVTLSAEEREKTLDKIVATLKDLISEKNKLSEMSKSLSGITDARGAQRIALALINSQH